MKKICRKDHEKMIYSWYDTDFRLELTKNFSWKRKSAARSHSVKIMDFSGAPDEWVELPAAAIS
jgi:hypothetical protein